MPDMYSARGRVRALNRLRWLAKWRRVQASRALGSSCKLAEWVRYVLIDPEVHTYSYSFVPDLSDLEKLALVTDSTTASLANFSEELSSAQLRSWIRSATKWRLESKRDPALGRHVLAYLAVRARKPEAVLELGVHHGLGSVVLLEALRINASEGYPGTLHSVDLNPANGWLAKGFLDSAWVLHRGHSVDVLNGLEGVSNVGVLVLDTTWDPTVTQQELALALRCAKSDLLVLHNSEWNSVVRDQAATSGGPIIRITEGARNRWPPGRLVDIARLPLYVS